MAHPTIRRHCPGLYFLTLHGRTIEIVQHEEFEGPEKWMWRDQGDRHAYSDPVRTKREAVASATAYAAERAAHPAAWA